MSLLDRAELSFPLMGTEAHIVLLDASRPLLDWTRRRLDDLERRWSRFRPDSEISQLNRATGTPLLVSTETVDVVTAAIEAWTWSGGRFDPTVGRTMQLAGYDRYARRAGDSGMPVQAETGHQVGPVIHRRCPTPADVVVDPYPGSVTVPPGVQLDLGGIGKGAAADLVATEVIRAGAGGCCINIGGDIRLAGRPPGREGWQVSIDPLAGSGHRQAGTATTAPVRIGVVEGAVCTSTTARRVWPGDRGAEHHLRDPATGAPLQKGLVAITVIAARATQAEVLTKTAFAAGLGEASDVITSAGATGLLVTDAGVTIPVDGLEPFLAAGGRMTASPVAA